MIEFFFELLGMLVFEFADFVTEQKVAKEAKYRHFYFWGGWLSCLAVLIMTGIVGLTTWAIVAISLRDDNFRWMLFLGFFLLGLLLFSLRRFWRNLKIMRHLRRVYFNL